MHIESLCHLSAHNCRLALQVSTVSIITPAGPHTCTTMVMLLARGALAKLPPPAPANCTARCTHRPLYCGYGSSTDGTKCSEAATDTSPLPTASNWRVLEGGMDDHGVVELAVVPALAAVNLWQ